MTTTYIYPFSDFARDLEAIQQPSSTGNARDFFTDMHEVIEYMKATYTNLDDRMERGAVIATASSFISRHMEHFDTGRIAVAGPSCSLVSDHLLRAVHWLVSPVALGHTDHAPDAAQVLALAQSFEEHARIEKEAEEFGASKGP